MAKSNYWQRKGFRAYMGHLFYVHTDLSMAVFALIGAVVEVVCGLCLRDEFFALWIAYPAAGFMAIAALCIVWSVIRWERRYSF